MSSVLIKGTKENPNRSDRVAIAIATCAALRLNKKVLILPLTTKFNPTDVLLGQRLSENKIITKGYRFEDSGVDALLRRIGQGAIDAASFSTVCTNITKDENLFDIASNPKSLDFEDSIPSIEVALSKILKHANKVYDLVIVLADTANDKSVEVLRKITDREITVIAQGPKVEVEDSPETIYVINNYDETSVFNYKKMKAIYGIKSDRKMYPFQYNIRFKDACRLKNAIEFLASNINEDQQDVNYVFLEELKRLTGAAMGIEKPIVEERKFVTKERASKKGKKVQGNE